MFKSYYVFIAVVLFSCLLLWSCNDNGGKVFATKDDSVKFAKSVAEIYRAEVCTLTAPPDTFKNGVQAIPTDTVRAYQQYYDKGPKLFDTAGRPYKGFSVDPAGYYKITSNPRIKGIYLRFGRRANGSYTIMLLGTDEKGNLITSAAATEREAVGDNTNFDHVLPCPTNCPAGDN